MTTTSADQSDSTIPLRAVSELFAIDTAELTYAWAVEWLDTLTSADVSKVAIATDDLLIPQVSSKQGCTGREHALAIEGSIPGSVYTSGDSVVVADLYEVRGEAASPPTSLPDEQHSPPMNRSMLCVNIENVGILVGLARAPDAFDETDLATAEEIADIVRHKQTQLTGTHPSPESDILDEIADMISHDLRNRVNVAIGNLELAHETHSDERFIKVGNALDQIQDMSEMIETLTRTGRPVHNLHPVELGEAALSAFNPLDHAQVSLSISASAMILADSNCLSQLLDNVIRNAIEHSPGQVHIEVGLLNDGFYIADDGPGIPADIRDEVSTHGYSTAPDHEGKGLAIVDRMAEAHGWQVAIEASSSGGTRVEFRDVVFV